MLGVAFETHMFSLDKAEKKQSVLFLKNHGVTHHNHSTENIVESVTFLSSQQLLIFVFQYLSQYKLITKRAHLRK